MSRLAKKLRSIRFQRNMTQAQAASEIGVTLYYYNYLENSKIKNPRQSTVEKIARFTGWTPEQVKRGL